MAKERLMKHVPCWLTMLACLNISIALTESDGSAVTHDKTEVAVSGKNFSVVCEVASSYISIHCRRAEDSENDHVFVFRDGRLVPEEEGPSFKDRVVLEKRDGKDCFILNNVTTHDNGTYECRGQTEENGLMKLNSTVQLDVRPPGETDGKRAGSGPSILTMTLIAGGVNEDLGLVAAGAVGVGLVLALVAGLSFLLYKKRKLPCVNSNKNSPDRPVNVVDEESAMIGQNRDGPEAVSAV